MVNVVNAALLAMMLLQAPASGEPPQTAVSDRVDYVVSQLVKNGYTQQDAEALFRDKRLEVLPPQKVQPHEIDWDAIIATLLKPDSVARGVDFLTRYKTALEQGETQYGVDPAFLTALLRLESNFGINSGKYVAFNVFYTLLTQQTEERRWRWAGDNLAALASYCKSRGEDCFDLHGSYGGALGPAQFLPFSVQQYGVDGNGDHIVDPFQMEDAIVSAANFLAQHNWSDDPGEALAQYYGTREGYVRAVFAYAGALRAAAAPPAAAALASAPTAPAAPPSTPSSTPLGSPAATP